MKRSDRCGMETAAKKRSAKKAEGDGECREMVTFVIPGTGIPSVGRSKKPNFNTKGETVLRKLAGQTAIYGISSIAARLLNYMLTPYLTRIMTTGEYGVITDLYALIPFVMILLTMGMETGYFRFAGHAATEGEKRNVFQTAWGAVTAVSVVFLAAVVLFYRDIAGAMGYGATPSYVWIVGTIIALDAVTAIPFAKLREENRAMRYVAVRVSTVALNVILCIFFYSGLPYIGLLSALWSPEYGAGYYLVSNLAASFLALLLLWPAYRGYRPRIDRRLFRTIFLYSLPLLISGVAGVANEFIDRQFIKYLMPSQIAMSSLGIYGAVVKIAVIMMLFVQMYRLAAEPFFLSGFKRDEFKRTNAEAMKYFMIVSVFVFLLIALFSDFFALIIGADFRQGIYILPVVLLANIFSGAVLNLSFWYKQTGKTKFAIVITGTGLLVTAGLKLLLIPRMGFNGAAWARLGCDFTMAAVSYALNQRYYKTPYDLRRIGFYFLVGGLLYGIGLVAARLDTGVLRALIDLALIGAFVETVRRKERIDTGALLRQLVKRK